MMTLFLVLAWSSPANACTVTLGSPDADGITDASPTFTWTGTSDCAAYRVQFATAPDFGAGRRVSRRTDQVSFHFGAGIWATLAAGDWAEGVYWRVIGFDTAGRGRWSDSRFLWTSSECTDTSICGPALGMPNVLCSDGVHTSGPTGICLQNGDGTCGWQVLSCPE